MAGRTYSFEINRTSGAPAATLFRLETDGGRWSDWARPFVLRSGWERRGDPDPGGIGAIRRIALGPVVLREETVEYEQDRRHVYRFAAPSPAAKDYRGEVRFTPNARGGTDLRWSGTFTEGRPGTGRVTRAVLRAGIAVLAARLVKAAERD